VCYRDNKEVQQLCWLPHLSEWQKSKHNTGEHISSLIIPVVLCKSLQIAEAKLPWLTMKQFLCIFCSCFFCHFVTPLSGILITVLYEIEFLWKNFCGAIAQAEGPG
jgi:hypothetical protein